MDANEKITSADQMVGAMKYQINFMKYFTDHASQELSNCSHEIINFIGKAAEQTQFEINYKKPEKKQGEWLVETKV